MRRGAGRAHHVVETLCLAGTTLLVDSDGISGHSGRLQVPALWSAVRGVGRRIEGT